MFYILRTGTHQVAGRRRSYSRSSGQTYLMQHSAGTPAAGTPAADLQPHAKEKGQRRPLPDFSNYNNNSLDQFTVPGFFLPLYLLGKKMPCRITTGHLSAHEKIRTSTPVKALPPQDSVSTNSTTCAAKGKTIHILLSKQLTFTKNFTIVRRL